MLLQKNSLTELPSEIGLLSNLRELNVGDNSIVKIPPSIGKLANLRKFQAWNNELSILPAELGDCKSLAEIDVSFNRITDFSITLTAPLALVTLSHNRISVFPHLKSSVVPFLINHLVTVIAGS